MVRRFVIHYDARGEQQHPKGDFVHWPDYQALLERAEAAERALAERAGGVRPLPERAPYEVLQVLGREYETTGDMWAALRDALTTEPAAPQEAEAVGSKRVRDAERIVRSFAEDRLKSTTQWALDPRYLITLCDAVRSRPSEQAVTEAMIEAAREIIHGARHVYSDIDLARAALKAAMEAGRHE